MLTVEKEAHYRVFINVELPQYRMFMNMKTSQHRVFMNVGGNQYGVNMNMDMERVQYRVFINGDDLSMARL